MNKKMNPGLREKIFSSSFFYTILSILTGFLVGALALGIGGYEPLASYAKLFNRIFGSTKTMSYSFIEYATPYILTGLSVAFSFKTGIFNIGAEGQYVIGSITAMLVGILVKLPPVLLIPLCIISALVAGGLWGALIGYLKVKFGANEVLCMIMLNWIAYYLSNFFSNLKGVNAGVGKTWTYQIQDAARITFPNNNNSIFSNKAHAGIFVAIIAVIIINYIINKTTLGFRLKAVGFNRHAAEYAGINANKNIMIALAISGSLASLAGCLQVMGVTYKISQFAGQEGYGFQGITVALIGNTNPIGVFFSGLFYGAMKYGGTKFDAPSEIVDIMMGCIVFFIAISGLLKSVFMKYANGGNQA